MRENKFKRGDLVRKISGYKFEGRVNGTFELFTKPGVFFVNVEHPDGWVMHFREKDLEKLP